MTLDTPPAADTDLSAYVLNLLDDHLDAMRGVRDRMRLTGTVSPGGRRLLALDSAALAEEYAARLARVLR
jgi:hypothetical protein